MSQSSYQIAEDALDAITETLRDAINEHGQALARAELELLLEEIDAVQLTERLVAKVGRHNYVCLLLGLLEHAVEHELLRVCTLDYTETDVPDLWEPGRIEPLKSGAAFADDSDSLIFAPPHGGMYQLCLVNGETHGQPAPEVSVPQGEW